MAFIPIIQISREPVRKKNLITRQDYGKMNDPVIRENSIYVDEDMTEMERSDMLKLGLRDSLMDIATVDAEKEAITFKSPEYIRKWRAARIAATLRKLKNADGISYGDLREAGRDFWEHPQLFSCNDSGSTEVMDFGRLVDRLCTNGFNHAGEFHIGSTVWLKF